MKNIFAMDISIEENGNSYGEADRFDKNPRRHAHVICERCHALSDLPLPDIAEIVRRNTGVIPTSYTLNVYHICPKCEKQI